MSYNSSRLKPARRNPHHLKQSDPILNYHLGKVHLLLAVAPLSRIDQVYQVVFEKILNEKISTRPVGVAGS